MYEKLFEPISVGNLLLKNRLVMPAMGTGYGDSGGFVTQKLIDHYQERAKNDVGLIIVEAACVTPGGKSMLNQISIDDDKFIPGLTKLSEHIKQAGAKCILQLNHAGRAAPGDSNVGLQLVAPSPVPMRGCAMPHELTIEEINEIIESFVQGTKRAQKAGFEGVELHFAHGYLVAQFFSPLVNKRKDKYGGDLDSRIRIGVEITKQVRQAVGSEYPVIARLGGDEFIKGGFNIKDAKITAAKLEEAGLDAINVTACYFSSHEEGYLNSPYASSITSMSAPHGVFAHLAGEIKKMVKIPVMVVGRLDDPNIALDVINTGKADLICIGRGLIADAEYVSKLYNNKQDDICRCIACRQCSITLSGEKQVRCAINAFVGREAGFQIESADKVKRILVIGGGPAGMEAARVAALRGHNVTLMEKKPYLGGNLIAAAGVYFKNDINYFSQYLSNAIYKAGVNVVLNTEVNENKVLEFKPDAVILASGSLPAIPDIPGKDKSNVLTAVQVLEEKTQTGDTIVVAGGGDVGCEVAVYLAKQDKSVAIVELRDTDFSVGSGLCLGMEPELRKWFYADVLPNLPINVIGKATFKEVTDEGLIIEDVEGGNSRLVKGDSIIFAAGMRGDNSIKEKIEGKVPELYEVGDCIMARQIIDAVTEAAEIALKI